MAVVGSVPRTPASKARGSVALDVQSHFKAHDATSGTRGTAGSKLRRQRLVIGHQSWCKRIVRCQSASRLILGVWEPVAGGAGSSSAVKPAS